MRILHVVKMRYCNPIILVYFIWIRRS